MVFIDWNPESHREAILGAAALVGKSADMLDERGRAALREDLQAAKAGKRRITVEYAEEHMRYCDQSELREVLGLEHDEAILPSKIIDSLVVELISAKPDSDTFSVSIDYSLPHEVTDSLLVVNFDASGNVVSIKQES